MKQLSKYINEKLVLNKDTFKKSEYKYFPSNKNQLMALIEDRLKKYGNNVDLNDIDTSEITDMSFVFTYGRKSFNGDISSWDVSNVTNMKWMFVDSDFNGDISDWDVSKVNDMGQMFMYSKFNGDISEWNVKKSTNMQDMFFDSAMKNIPDWYEE